MKPRATFGYTLIEMSVVLVVIGLLVGAVLAGKSLIRASQLTSVVEDANHYAAAMREFKLQYNEYPGDFTKATDIWGLANADAATCRDMDKSGGTATCNGNGDGAIGTEEMFFVWQHLSNAGSITGKYTGAHGAGGVEAHEAGVNCPKSKLGDGSGFGTHVVGTVTADPAWFDGTYGHALFFGRPSNAAVMPSPSLTPEEAWSLDSKYDDGLPAQGSIVTFNSNMPLLVNCTETSAGSGAATTFDDLDAVYRLGNASQACMLIFRNIFE